jgi:hypothetical protein
LADLEARWLYRMMLDPQMSREVRPQWTRQFVDLQRRRLQFAELAAQMEAFAPRFPQPGDSSPWLAAAEAYGSAGDWNNQLRVLAPLPYSQLGRDLRPYLLFAREIETVPARRSELDSKITDARNGLRLQQLNLARQPIIHDALEQDRAVRPRLTAATLPLAPAGEQGGNP